MTNRLRSQLDESSGAGHISFATQYWIKGVAQNRDMTKVLNRNAIISQFRQHCLNHEINKCGRCIKKKLAI